VVTRQLSCYFLGHLAASRSITTNNGEGAPALMGSDRRWQERLKVVAIATRDCTYLPILVAPFWLDEVSTTNLRRIQVPDAKVSRDEEANMPSGSHNQGHEAK